MAEKSTKKIVISTGIYPPDIGGPATYSATLNDELPKNGWDVSVSSFGLVRKHKRFIRHLLYLKQLFLDSKGAQIVYAQDPVSVGFAAWIMARLRGIPFVLKIVGDFAWEQGVARFGVEDTLDDFAKKTYGYHVYVIVLKKVESFVANRADGIVVPSQYLKKIVTSWGVNPDKITVIYNSFEPRFHIVAKKTSKAFELVSIARLVPWKGFDSVLKALVFLKQGMDNIHMTIIGDGPEEEKLKNLAVSAGITDVLTFAGRLSHDEVMERLANSDAMILNTEYEGFSHVILESLAVGVPVLTTPVGGNVEIIKHGKNGMFFGVNNVNEIAEAVYNYAHTPDEIVRAMKKEAVETATQFTRERMIKEINDYLDSFV